MRKHDVRKWLHAILDLLPVILIPVFMIYSHRHTIDSGSIDVPQNEVVDFNQLAPKVVDAYTYFTFTNNGEFVVNEQVLNTSVFNGSVGPNELAPVIKNHVYYLNIVSDFDSPLVFNFYSGSSYGNGSFVVSYLDDWKFVLGYSTDVQVGTYHCYINIIDLTQMFGSGNEPTLEQFETLYPKQYYDYTLSRKDLIKGVSTITYDDTDIMSQVVYQLYNSVDKYFNMGNVFNMTGVYDWFNLNIFNGNAPISIYIVWNIVLYEFVMDLLFLLYGLFMWFIDMVEKLMEKPLKSVK